VGVDFDEPVVPWDVAIAAARLHAFMVAAMRRIFEKRVIGLKSHRVAGSAKGVGRTVAIHRDAGDDAARAEHAGDDQEGDQQLGIEPHCQVVQLPSERLSSTSISRRQPVEE
jgi:hypothetical protein